MTPAARPAPAPAPVPGPALDAVALRQPLGEVATFLQLSSGFCAPCRATRQVLQRVVGTAPGVAHVEVDVAQRGDLAEAYGVTRTPTVVLLDAAGTPVARIEGVPRLAQARAAVAAVRPA